MQAAASRPNGTVGVCNGEVDRAPIWQPERELRALPVKVGQDKIGHWRDVPLDVQGRQHGLVGGFGELLVDRKMIANSPQGPLTLAEYLSFVCQLFDEALHRCQARLGSRNCRRTL